MNKLEEFYRRTELVVMDDEDAAKEDMDQKIHEAAAKRLDKFMFRALRLLANYDGNRAMAIDCLILAYGQGGELIPERSATAVSKKHFGTESKKAAVTKCVKHFVDCLELPPLAGQRSDQARAAMTFSRKHQLGKKKS